MNARQQLFVEYYLGVANANATEAARLAGYAHPEKEGWRLVRTNPEVQALVGKRVAEVAMGADQVLGLLADHATGSMEDFISFTEKGQPYVDLKRASDAGKLHLIRKVGKQFGEIQIELYDAQAALIALGRYHKLFTDKVETVDNSTITVEYVNDWQ